jgi:hypothetical protein
VADIVNGNYSLNYSYERVPTLAEFAKSDAFVRGVVGCFGSGKSSACTIELIRRGLTQQPNKQGIRKTRFAVIRQTYRQLEDTTKKTIFDWLPPAVFGKYQVAKNIYTITAFPDTEIEIIFRALDNPDDVNNLLSLELTGAWINEAKEISVEILDALTGRVGRYPSVKDGGCTWSGIWMDTNPPDEDSWWFKRFELEKPDGWEVYHQPSGLSPDAENLLSEEEYEELQRNPDADIVPGLPPDYYKKLMIGKSKDFINVFIKGQYGLLKAGKPVFEKSYSDDLHWAGYEIKPIMNNLIVVGFDFGLNPSAIFTQYTPKGRFIVLDELTSDGVGLEQFMKFTFEPFVKKKYEGYEILVVGDPAGVQKSQSDETSCFDILRHFKYKAIPAKTNVLVERLGAVEYFLNSLVEGKPRFLLSDTCPLLRKGFMAGYHYKRMRVSGEVYKEVPEKNWASHLCFIAGTKINTRNGIKNIEDIQINDYVETPFGYNKVTNTFNREAETVKLDFTDGTSIISTPDHPFWNGACFSPVDALQYGNVIFKEDLVWKHLFQLNRSLLGRNGQYMNLEELGIIKSHQVDIINQLMIMEMNTYIEKFGNITMEKFQKDMLSIIKTRIPKITELKILNLLQQVNTPNFIQEKKEGLKNQEQLLSKLLKQQQNGESKILKKHQSLGVKVLKDYVSVMDKLEKLVDVFIVEKNIQLQKDMQRRDSVQQNVNQHIEELQELIMKLEVVLYVELLSQLINTPKLKPALKIVGKSYSVGKRKVYNITVEKAHSYYANNCLVSNCDGLQYACLYFKTDSNKDKFNIPKKTFNPAISYAGY